MASLSSSRIAAILVRGVVKGSQPLKDTLRILNLSRKNHCVVIDNTPVFRGMMQKAKDYLTWGEISEDTFQKLLAARGKEIRERTHDRKGKYAYHSLDVNGKKFLPYFTLNSPRKGFGRKGVKVSFKAGGALGYRGEKLNDLILRML